MIDFFLQPRPSFRPIFQNARHPPRRRYSRYRTDGTGIASKENEGADTKNSRYNVIDDNLYSRDGFSHTYSDYLPPEKKKSPSLFQYLLPSWITVEPATGAKSLDNKAGLPTESARSSGGRQLSDDLLTRPIKRRKVTSLPLLSRELIKLHFCPVATFELLARH